MNHTGEEGDLKIKENVSHTNVTNGYFKKPSSKYDIFMNNKPHADWTYLIIMKVRTNERTNE